jgi:hypothetical protein
MKRIVLIALVVAVLVVTFRRAADRGVVFRSSAGTSLDRGRHPDTPRKPQPVSPGFEGCPANGDGGDRELNVLKNRVDSAAWVATPFASILDFTWPPNVTRRFRGEWTRRDSVAVAETEDVPIVVEGYFAGAKVEGPEATNCHGAESKFRDWHLWLSATPGKDRRRSIVVETTPAVRALHPEWSITDIHKLVRDSAYVRVSGWLMLDQEHPEQIGKTRGTLWEIHPVMKIEVMRNGGWSPIPQRTR